MPLFYFFTLQIYHEMESIARDFPNLASRVKIGHSFENRSMYVLKVRPMYFEGPDWTQALGSLCPGLSPHAS